MGEWRTITAEQPPRGVKVILFEPAFKNGPARVVVDYWPTGYPRQASHWLPLPAPPKEAAG